MDNFGSEFAKLNEGYKTIRNLHLMHCPKLRMGQLLDMFESWCEEEGYDYYYANDAKFIKLWKEFFEVNYIYQD